MNKENKNNENESHSPLSGVVESQKHQCGQCGRWFDTKEEVNSHSHVNDIAEQMREDGESEEDIQAFIRGSRDMGW